MLTDGLNWGVGEGAEMKVVTSMIFILKNLLALDTMCSDKEPARVAV